MQIKWKVSAESRVISWDVHSGKLYG